MLTARKYAEMFDGAELFKDAFNKDSITRLFSDPRKFLGLLWLSLEKQATELKVPVERDELLDSMSADTAEQAFIALYEAILDACGSAEKNVLKLAWEKSYRQHSKVREQAIRKMEQSLTLDSPSESSTVLPGSAELKDGTSPQ
jgi:hypothetical protein